MHLDVVDLRAFYYRTKLGRIVQKSLREQVAKLWGSSKGQTVLGFGFAAPLLRPFMKDARRVICLMPGQQGVMPWPEGMENHSVLCEETMWPIGTGMVDKMLILHGLETCDKAGDLLEEVWRVLGPGGKVLFIVPNRSGLWARSDRTPFGFGRPYSPSQLETQLRKHNFLTERHMSALFFPPSETGFWLKFAKYFEGFGLRGLFPIVAGVVMIEATKQVYARPPSGLGEAVRGQLEALEEIATASGKPVAGRGRNGV